MPIGDQAIGKPGCSFFSPTEISGRKTSLSSVSVVVGLHF
jgi:hypothetical protein